MNGDIPKYRVSHRTAFSLLSLLPLLLLNDCIASGCLFDIVYLCWLYFTLDVRSALLTTRISRSLFFRFLLIITTLSRFLYFCNGVALSSHHTQPRTPHHRLLSSRSTRRGPRLSTEFSRTLETHLLCIQPPRETSQGLQ